MGFTCLWNYKIWRLVAGGITIGEGGVAEQNCPQLIVLNFQVVATPVVD